ncbi:MAG: nitrite/sulfite reductase [Myxococcota bacterium]
MYQYNERDRLLVRERVAEFRDQVRRRLSGELSEDDFRPLRLMNGLYLQRHAYMLRVSIPYGLVDSRQMRAFGAIAERYDRGFGHWTTRQNIQFNWLKLEDVPDILQLLAQVDMHAMQTSGNCVRNITNDPYAGVAEDELWDTRPLSEIIRQYKELHPEFMYLPRKFKIAMSGGADDRAAVAFHDVGLRATVRDGVRGTKVYVGGGMGRTPRIGKLLCDFLPLEHTLSYIEAILRVYNLHGRRDNKYKARIKILVGAMGIDAFREAVEAEWCLIKDQTLDLNELDDVAAMFDLVDYDPDAPAAQDFEARRETDDDFARWLTHNTLPHKQPGYRIVTCSVKPHGQPPGDIATEQLYGLATVMERFNGGLACVTYNQNVCLQDIHQRDLGALYDALVALGLATANIDTLADMICCPGFDYCSLANAGSIGIAKRINEHFDDLHEVQDIGKLHVNMSGCINACGHHHTGHIGILGIDKRGEDYYQICVGGHAGSNEELPASIGAIIGPAVPPDRVPHVLENLLSIYREVRHDDESFIATVNRVGVDPFKEAIDG